MAHGMVVRLSALRAGRPGAYFCQRQSRPQGHSAAGRIRSIEKSIDLIRNRTRDIPACSIVPQPTSLPRAPHEYLEYNRKTVSYDQFRNYCCGDWRDISMAMVSVLVCIASSRYCLMLLHGVGDSICKRADQLCGSA
jgi:hypothetical protein